MSLHLRMTSTDAEVGRKILGAFRTRLNAALHRAAPAIRTRLGGVCESLIARTEEYSSLLHGALLGELGIPDVESRVDAILAAIKASLSVAVVPVQVVGESVTGGLTVGILRADYEDILGLSSASYVSGPSGATIPWLKWLIGEGDRIIVFDHRVKADLSAAEKARSRTGLALMVPDGGGWRVPPNFAGTADDNWLLRAFDAGEAGNLIARVIREEIERRLT